MHKFINKYLKSFVIPPYAVVFFFYLSTSSLVLAQASLDNPSFEDEVADATMPTSWRACTRGTTPDILPGPWGVYNVPCQGFSYVGLITREDGSHEAIGQRLSSIIAKGSCWEWSLCLGHSKVYAGYNKPIRLAIYLGESRCELGQMIYQSDWIKKEDWEKIVFSFTAQIEGRYITLVADDGGKKINGNVLIDHLGPLTPCDRASIPTWLDRL